jgi:hypothetical protein
MKQVEIFKKIGVILSELNEQYEFIENTIDNINDLELELFSANTHYLIENIEVLRKHNKQREAQPTPEEAPPFTEKFFEPVVQQPAQTFYPEKKDTAVKFEETPEPEIIPEPVAAEPIIRHELIMDNIEDPIAYDEEDIALIEDEPETEEIPQVEEAPPIEVVAEVPTPETVATPAPVAEPKTAADKPAATIRDIIAAQLASTRVADKFDLPAIKDLKGAISLNDKLLYVKDLFNGYSMAYSEAIEILNRFNRFEEADTFLKNNYVKKNNWEAKQATADKFYVLLRRRYPD